MAPVWYPIDSDIMAVDTLLLFKIVAKVCRAKSEWKVNILINNILLLCDYKIDWHPKYHKYAIPYSPHPQI